jgi:hypothetical protein
MNERTNKETNILEQLYTNYEFLAARCGYLPGEALGYTTTGDSNPDNYI